MNHSLKCPVSKSKLSDNLMKVNRIFIEWENEGGPSFWVLTTSWTLCPINVRYPFPVWIKIRQLFYFRHFWVYSNCFFVKHKNSFSTNCSFNYETLITLLHIIGRLITIRQQSSRLSDDGSDKSGEARHGIIVSSKSFEVIRVQIVTGVAITAQPPL